ncbi:MAG: uracil phosphoribosyltransferase, partial [Mucinivorans sp.]
MIRILGEQNTVLNQFVAELRDENIQKDAMRFRRNLERVGQLMAYEISRTLNYYPSEVATPLGQKPINLPTSRIVLATVLRAGLPFHSGFLSIFDKAENGFVSAYRHFSKDGTMHIKMEQVTTPPLEDKTLILIDPMLATGQSIEAAYNALIDKGGVPMQTHFAAIISSIE